jgi:hypothetical protein
MMLMTAKEPGHNDVFLKKRPFATFMCAIRNAEEITWLTATALFAFQTKKVAMFVKPNFRNPVGTSFRSA